MPTDEATAKPEPTETVEPAATPTPPRIEDCANGPTATIYLPGDAYHGSGTNTAVMEGENFDTGAREGASGEPTFNAEGQIVSYTIQPGDMASVIASRFCIFEDTLIEYNKTMGYDLQIGQTFRLRPDPDEAWQQPTVEDRVIASCEAGYKNGIDMDSNLPRVKGAIADFGERAGAKGAVSRDDEDRIVTHTVVDGDNLTAVADRFCFDADELVAYNETGASLNTGDVLVLRPDSEED
jgi:LysM repeat protein